MDYIFLTFSNDREFQSLYDIVTCLMVTDLQVATEKFLTLPHMDMWAISSVHYVAPLQNLHLSKFLYDLTYIKNCWDTLIGPILPSVVITNSELSNLFHTLDSPRWLTPEAQK